MNFKYLSESFARKKARRVFQEYPCKREVFELKEEGSIEFANWENPLAPRKVLTQSEVNFFKKFIPKGSFAIDIGSNVGDTTVPMALAAGKDGLVLGFEPNPHIFKILTNNADLNPGKVNIVPLHFAITDNDGEFYYQSSEASFANGGISEQPTKYHGSYLLSEKIRGINLEKYLHHHYADRIEQLSFIKIDTEGYDKEIIRSIQPVLKQYKPAVIAECFAKLNEAERGDLYNLLAQNGYELFYFEDFLEDTDVQPIKEPKDMMKWKHFNLYAV